MGMDLFTILKWIRHLLWIGVWIGSSILVGIWSRPGGLFIFVGGVMIYYWGRKRGLFVGPSASEAQPRIEHSEQEAKLLVTQVLRNHAVERGDGVVRESHRPPYLAKGSSSSPAR